MQGEVLLQQLHEQGEYDRVFLFDVARNFHSKAQLLKLVEQMQKEDLWFASLAHIDALSRRARISVDVAAAVRTGGEEAAASLLERLVAHVGPDGVRAHLMYLPEDDLVALRRIAEAQGTDAVRAHLADPVPAVFTGETTVAALTGQERAVVTAMVHHPTRASVASALHVSENTVKTHLQRIYRKLGVNSRAGVIERAIELGLLDPA